MYNTNSLDYTAILRTLDHSDLVKEAIASLKHQSIPPREIIIIDSGSTDKEREKLKALADRFIDVSFRPFNYAFSINIGIFNCQTSYALVISSHVRLTEKKAIEKLWQSLTSAPELCAAYVVPAAQAKSRQTKPSWEMDIIDAKKFTGRNGLTNACSLLRCSDIRRHPFPEAVWAAEDQAWAARELNQGRKTLRVVSSGMHYENPRTNEKKRRNEQLAIAYYVNPRDGSWLRIIELLLKTLRQWFRGDGTQARNTFLLTKGLLGLKFRRIPTHSRYF